jgi:phage tail-like protein
MPEKSYTFKLTISGPDGFLKDFEVPIGITTIGREPDNGLVLEYSTVSRYHARLECVPDECSITDLGSSNGTFINKVKIPAKSPQVIRNDDRISVGPHFDMTFQQIELLPAPALEEPPVQAEIVLPKPEEKPLDLPPEAEGPGEPPVPPLFPIPDAEDDGEMIVPGLSIHFRRFLNYLPGIYHTDFMASFLSIFEAIQMPIVWTIDNFDQFLSPRTAPTEFLPWLANWFEAEFDSTWSETQKRWFLEEAWLLFARRGTKWSVVRILEIYTGQTPVVDDLASDLRPHLFRVTVPLKEASINRTSVESLINHYKPAHTDYELYFRG